MRTLSLLLAATLASSWPAPAAAAAVSIVRIAPPAGAPSIATPLPPLTAGASLLPPGAPALLAPSLSPSPPAPQFSAAPAAAAAVVSPAAAPPASPAVAAARAKTATATASAAKSLETSASRVTASAAVDPSGPAARTELDALFTGETSRPVADLPVAAAAYTDGPAAPRPSDLAPAPAKRPLDTQKAKRVRGMFAGTAAMKIGMETVKLSIPLLVLQTMGGATVVACLIVADSVAQALFAGAAGSLLDRLPAPKILGGALVTQAVIVSSIISLGAAGMLTPWALLPLYLLFGGAVGIAETSRHSIPPLILGHDEEALSRYNARLHIFYEVAGVTGALATGALIAFVGPLWTLALQPPAYLLGGFLFWRVKLAEKAALKAGFTKPVLPPLLSSVSGRIADYFKDLKAGAGLVMKNDRLRWVAVAFVLPQIVHRILEGLIIPIYAKRVLESPGTSGILMAASCTGELLGAALLLRLASRIKAPRWVKRCASAILLCWVLAFTHALPAAFLAIMAMSLTWSSSDLALRSDIQSSLGDKDHPRAASFLYSSLVLGAGLVTLLLGLLIDAVAMTPALYGIFALYSAVAAAVFLAGRRLGASKP